MKNIDLEHYFLPYRNNIIGINQTHAFKTGIREVVYADWAASGRLYRPVENFLANNIGPYVANTHTETTLMGCTMTHAYHQAKNIIKEHVGANNEDILLFEGFGMTAAINKFQRMLGLRLHEKFKSHVELVEDERPLIIITHMEHHSNQVSWIECEVDVEILRRAEDGTPDLDHLEDLLKIHRSRKLKIGAFTACSNVTGIFSPYYEMAELMHRYDGYVCIDFSGSAPYVNIDMHPENREKHLDVILFSPHKFLGGPGSSGVVVFNQKLYRNQIPDCPGGGTVKWTNPWGEHRYYDEVELREDGGTPGFLQAIRASLAILLKEEMGVNNILAHEEKQKSQLLTGLLNNPFIHILEPQQHSRLGFISFYSREIHFNLFTKLLNDYFGIQVRGGCSCAGTYGHFLLAVDQKQSRIITNKIDAGDLSEKPGWVRISLHPTLSADEIETIIEGVNAVTTNYKQWSKEYNFDAVSGEFSAIQGAEKYLNIKNIVLS